MSRGPGTRKRATEDQEAQAQLLAEEFGSLTNAVYKTVLDNYMPVGHHHEGPVFTTLMVAEKLGVHRDHVSGSLKRLDHDEVRLCKQNKTHYFLQRRDTEPKQQSTTTETTDIDLSKTPAYVLESYQNGDKLVWIAGQVFFATPAALRTPAPTIPRPMSGHDIVQRHYGET